MVQRRPSLVNAAALRIALAKAPWNQSEITPNDRLLSIGLAKIGEFETARRLSSILVSGAQSTKSDNLLVNSDFSRSPLLPPFDWQLATTGSLGGSINPSAKNLAVSAIGGARGSAAQQLVRLFPGNYRLGWALSSDMPLPSKALSARIECAEEGTKSVPIGPIPLVAGRQQRIIAVPDGECGWYWLSLHVTLADDAPGIDAYFHGVSLIPVRKNGDAADKSGPSS